MKRALKPPGIGVELEARNFKLSNDNPEAASADEKLVYAIKGSTLVAEPEVPYTCAPFWDLTAELGGTEEYTGRSCLSCALK